MTRVQIHAPGIYDMPADAYHADPCPEPSLSSSIANRFCQASPAHARVCHPRLCESVVEEEAEHFDIGTAAHAILLEGINSVEIIEAKDWRTNAAKDARDQARKDGRIPLLRKVWADVEAMVLAARVQLDAHEDGCEMFCAGKPEQTLIWREDEVWCRARLDWLRVGNIDDYKTTKATANPDAISRTLFTNGWDVQAAFYLRGLKALTGIDGTFRFAVQETYPPYALSVVGLGPSAMVIAQKKVIWSLEHWRESLRSQTWPGYPRKTAYADLPAWIESAWHEKEMQEVR